MSQSRLSELRINDLALYAAVAAAGSNESWGILQRIVAERTSQQLLEFDDCAMILHHAMSGDRPENACATTRMLTEYVLNTHHDKVLDYLKVGPAFVCGTM